MNKQTLAMTVLGTVAIFGVAPNAQATTTIDSCGLTTPCVEGDNSSSGSGVKGTSSTGNGVYGVSGSGSPNQAGITGQNTANGYGVLGLGAEGVVGQGSGIGSYGVIGESSGENSIGVSGTCSGIGCLAGSFTGSVDMTGTLQVGQNLQVDGNLLVLGTCTGCSDLRLKTNVKPLGGAVDQLLRLKGVTFEWKDPAVLGHGHENETGTQLGFIAQDIEKVYPQWVNQKGYTAPDGQTYRTIDLRQIEALEVESIRELKAENNALRERMTALENARRPVAAGALGNAGLGVGGLALAGALVFARRRRTDERA
jgi:Chaperone of endosialidase